MIYRFIVLMLVVFLATPLFLFAQNCPENIGFENGNFQHWRMYTGWTEISNRFNTVKMSENYTPVDIRQTIMTDGKVLDPYGNFPVIPKNGGNFSVKLGNDGTGAQAEGISYLLNIPVNKPEFTLTYQYAVVLEDPNHEPEEQPRFIARVKDVSTGNYIPCASFEYIATSGLPGFKKSASNPKVIYKEWSAVTINLSGYEGKQLLLEFITTDCTLTGHFGYAYVDVNNTCGDMIVGNKYCKGLDQMNISGPSGFKSYTWFNQDRTITYGSGQSITIKPTPADGSKILLDLIPYEGYGCPNTISAIATSVDYQLVTLLKDTVCYGTTVDLLSNRYILNKVEDFEYLAFEDKDLTIPVKNPLIKQSKIYYIKATNYKGCESVSTVEILLNGLEKIKIINPQPACHTESVDITKNEIYDGDLTGINRRYYADQDAQIVLKNPESVTLPNIYYVKLTSNAGCTKILPIEAKFLPKPILLIQNPTVVCSPGEISISDLKNFEGSDKDLTYTFYADQEYTVPINNPAKIDKSGTYYVKAVNNSGCIVYGKINTTVYNLPVLSVKNPEAVCYPQTVDITQKAIYNGSTENCSYSYYIDQSLTKKLNNPSNLNKSGTYYVKLTNPNGCETSNKVDVVINNLPIIVINKTQTIFDNEFIDLTAPTIINGSKNYVSVGYFLDMELKKKIQDPTRINKAGRYYISLTNENGCSVSAPIDLNILPKPNILVPTAFTPQQQQNNRLYPFLVSIQKLLSFKVYNKWGILVYETNTLQNSGWDGQFKSKLQPFETFSWFAEGLDLKGGICQSKGKTIMIL